jgi:hypothetical protein
MSNKPIHSGPTSSGRVRPPVVIREATPADEPALSRLAQLDSARQLQRPALVAEDDGELRAALSLADDAAIADPFHHTADLLAMLRVQAGAADGGAPRRAGLVGRIATALSPQAQPSGWRTIGRRLAAASSRRRTGVV